MDYLTGHTISTYHDIQMKGVKFLRNVYISLAWGMNPEKVLIKEALAEPHRIYVKPVRPRRESGSSVESSPKGDVT